MEPPKHGATQAKTSWCHKARLGGAACDGCFGDVEVLVGLAVGFEFHLVFLERELNGRVEGNQGFVRWVSTGQCD